MRIAHIISTFPPHVGGMGSVCYDEAKLLAERGHEVTVFTLKYPHIVYNDTQFYFKVARLKPLVRLGDAGLVPQLLWKLKKDFDLVHLHYPFYGGAEWLYFSKIPMVITYHMDAQVGGVKGLVAKIYDWLWSKLLFAQARKIISVDVDHCQHLKFYKEVKNKIIEIPNGVDTEIFKPAPVSCRDLNLPDLEGKKIILFVGNMLPIKRLDLLLRAIKLLNDNNAALLVVGGGYHLEDYKQMAKNLGISAQTHFVGHLDDQKKLAAYYNLATCLAMPSDYESFSLVVAEALASGLPVVASDIASVKNRVNNGQEGLFFEKGSGGSLAVALKKIMAMSVEERKAMGQKGRAEMENKYAWGQHMEKLINLYNNIVEHDI